MHHFVYCTTHVPTGRYYIGVHSSMSLDDGYRGSGRIITRALRKYPREQFAFRVLGEFGTRQEAEEVEEMIVQPFLLDKSLFPLIMNLAPGGRGGVGSIPKSEAHRAAMGESQRKRYAGRPPMATKPVIEPKEPKPRPRTSAATRAKISAAIAAHHKAHPRSEETRQLLSRAQTGKVMPPVTSEVCAQRREAALKQWARWRAAKAKVLVNTCDT